ncbi:MAG: TauD/TfdA family dioxygenase [Gammaproteobacteria bacterium]|nr:TauD/TfdA family dioxygenase [Gammaproteobacteria bacterium]
MSLRIRPSGQACGAEATGIDLTQPLSADLVAEVRAAWLQHKVLSFPDQRLSDDDLERFTRAFGGFGDDPFIAPIEGRNNIIAVERKAEEKAPLFAENWHTDWSFQAAPPAGTCLFGITVPPVGGDTLFANQQLAWQALPAETQAKYRDLIAIHSAKTAYAPEGMYGKEDQTTDRSMKIMPSDAALALQTHPLVQAHPETGELGFFSCLGYIVGIEGYSEQDAFSLLSELRTWQGRDEFVYTHKWQPNMLVMWDNRALLHRATGGHEGYDRLLHRTTIRAYSPR